MLGGSLTQRHTILVAAIFFAFVAGLAAVLLLGKPAAGAGTLPSGFSQERFVGGLTGPNAMEFAPDGRLFVAEDAGKLRVVKNGQLLAAPFVDLTASTNAEGERGLLGIAFDPDFASNGFVYVYHTKEGTGGDPPRNRVVRYTASDDRAVPGSGRVILSLPPLQATNHNGGAIHFGSDGKLYVAVGDNARQETAQSLNSTLGKMLRINKDGTIPSDNPFFTRTSGANRTIWARGLRNPYTFSVQPGTGRIHINDVGAQTWEEINLGKRGANYGWPVHEGPETDPAYVPPIFAYRHDGPAATSGCAITGGAFYNPRTRTFPASYEGDYFFADFCNGWIRRYDVATDTVTPFKGTSGEGIVDLKVSAAGQLFFLARNTGSVERIRFTP